MEREATHRIFAPQKQLLRADTTIPHNFIRERFTSLGRLARWSEDRRRRQWREGVGGRFGGGGEG